MDCAARSIHHSPLSQSPPPPSMPLVTAAAAPAKSPATIAERGAGQLEHQQAGDAEPRRRRRRRERLAVDDAREDRDRERLRVDDHAAQAGGGAAGPRRGTPGTRCRRRARRERREPRVFAFLAKAGSATPPRDEHQAGGHEPHGGHEREASSREAPPSWRPWTCPKGKRRHERRAAERARQHTGRTIVRPRVVRRGGRVRTRRALVDVAFVLAQHARSLHPHHHALQILIARRRGGLRDVVHVYARARVLRRATRHPGRRLSGVRARATHGAAQRLRGDARGGRNTARPASRGRATAPDRRGRRHPLRRVQRNEEVVANWQRGVPVEPSKNHSFCDYFRLGFM